MAQSTKSAAPATNKLTASVRTETGKGASRRARREGRIPAVLYGRGTEPQHLLLPGHDFAAVMRHAGTNAVLTLDIDGTDQLALTRALDIHPIRRDIRHVDLLVIRRGEKVIVEINIVIEGEAVPGTLVTQDATWVEVEAEVLSIPDQLVVDISGAEPGTQYTAGDLALPEGVELISEPDWLLVNVLEAPKAEELEPEAEAGEEAAEAPAEAEAAEASE